VFLDVVLGYGRNGDRRYDDQRGQDGGGDQRNFNPFLHGSSVCGQCGIREILRSRLVSYRFFPVCGLFPLFRVPRIFREAFHLPFGRPDVRASENRPECCRTAVRPLSECRPNTV
jgi:hypothetical protein